MCATLVPVPGIRVLASDRLPEREPDVLAAGAGWDGDTARLASRAEVLITVLPGSSELGETRWRSRCRRSRRKAPLGST